MFSDQVPWYQLGVGDGWQKCDGRCEGVVREARRGIVASMFVGRDFLYIVRVQANYDDMVQLHG